MSILLGSADSSVRGPSVESPSAEEVGARGEFASKVDRDDVGETSAVDVGVEVDSSSEGAWVSFKYC